jgi:outer membrane protein OmpA-like peptidoglycan-associated protein
MIIGNFQPYNIPDDKLYKYNILSFCIDDAKLINYTDKFKEDNVESGEEFLLHDVSFENKKLSINSYKSLNLLFSLLKNSAIEVLIESYSKNESNEVNVNRAKTVADYLTSKGIASNRIQYKGFGKAVPVLASYKVEGKKPQNQWIVVKILKK